MHILHEENNVHLKVNQPSVENDREFGSVRAILVFSITDDAPNTDWRVSVFAAENKKREKNTTYAATQASTTGKKQKLKENTKCGNVILLSL